MESLDWCKKRTYLYGPPNSSVSCSAVLGREWKFAQLRRYLSPGTVFATAKGSYEQEAMDKESLKMETLGWRNKRTYRHGPPNCSVSCSAV